MSLCVRVVGCGRARGRRRAAMRGGRRERTCADPVPRAGGSVDGRLGLAYSNPSSGGHAASRWHKDPGMKGGKVWRFCCSNGVVLRYPANVQEDMRQLIISKEPRLRSARGCAGKPGPKKKEQMPNVCENKQEQMICTWPTRS